MTHKRLLTACFLTVLSLAVLTGCDKKEEDADNTTPAATTEATTEAVTTEEASTDTTTEEASTEEEISDVVDEDANGEEEGAGWSVRIVMDFMIFKSVICPRKGWNRLLR